MLTRQFVRENPDAVREALEARGTDDVDLDRILGSDEEWRELKAEGDDLRHQRNEAFQTRRAGIRFRRENHEFALQRGGS